MVPISMHSLALIEMPCMVAMVPSQPMPWLYVCEMDIRQCLKVKSVVLLCYHPIILQSTL